jgi:hypothetical protein
MGDLAGDRLVSIETWPSTNSTRWSSFLDVLSSAAQVLHFLFSPRRDASSKSYTLGRGMALYGTNMSPCRVRAARVKDWLVVSETVAYKVSGRLPGDFV